MPRLIVNGDDFGLTGGVNRAVQEAHSAGLLTSTTVLVTAPEADEAGELPRRWPGLDVGVHVNLTQGRPAAGAARVRTLVDEEGQLHRRGVLRRRLVQGRVDRREVRREVAAQVAALRALGVEPSHWDAHEQVAFWPGLVGPVAAAARDAGLLRSRTPRVWVVAGDGARRLSRWRWRLGRPWRLLTDTQRALAAARLARQFATPAWQLYPQPSPRAGDQEASWLRALGALPAGVCEAVAHPGHVDSVLRALSPELCLQREEDLRLLRDPATARRLRDAGVRLIGYRELGR